MNTRNRARQTLDRLREELLAERTTDGHWEGELAASALSTATAISAMSAVALNTDDRTAGDAELIARGIGYLRGQQNDDGGFGDTDRSHSNIATSYLVLAASTLAEKAVGESMTAIRFDQSALDKLASYLEKAGGIEGLRRRYGTDKTFVIPILTNLAIAGLVDWDDVAALPFEAAVFPQSMYRLLQMPVVSYAIPALVAIGQARHFHGKRAMAPLRWVRQAAVPRTMKVLVRMQPESGGYLEATPLTSFVVMSLAATDRSTHEVTQCGMRFLRESMRDEGSWPIDTNLATWVTSLAVHALACDPDDDASWCQESLIRWQLSCQHKERHPYTGAEPGGWGWTDLSGAVPDSDDTPAAILALSYQRQYTSDELKSDIDVAIQAGRGWLLQLQNRNGGWPTFCRGWGKLPFDRSSTDLTAHALRALGDEAPAKCARDARSFLDQQQRPDGSWLPLWFGNQDVADESNPIYGTARVLLAGCVDEQAMQRALEFLIAQQNVDGGWGGGPSVVEKIRSRLGSLSAICGDDLVSSIEETALVVEALATTILLKRDHANSHQTEQNGRDSGGLVGVRTISQSAASDYGADSGGDFKERQMSGESTPVGGNDDALAAIIRGVEFLHQSVEDGRHRVAWPIGFYFAKLWYHERLYPLIFTIGALGKFLRATADDHDEDWPR